jgi:hypothetical protein
MKYLCICKSYYLTLSILKFIPEKKIKKMKIFYEFLIKKYNFILFKLNFIINLLK